MSQPSPQAADRGRSVGVLVLAVTMIVSACPTDPRAGPGADTQSKASSKPPPAMSRVKESTMSQPASQAPKTGSDELRTDPGPLLQRFPLLGRPLSTKWMSGTTGDPRVPGPSTYWIDAIVVLNPEQAETLRRQYPLQPAAADEVPGVVPAMHPLLPAGPWQTSAALDAALSQQGFSGRAHLSGNHLVLVALGQ